MRVVIAEDAAILREGMVALLAMRGHTAVAVPDAGALAAAVAAAPATPAFDVAVIDIRLPPTFTDEGVRAALALRAAYPRLGILLFSQYVDVRYAMDLLAGVPTGVGYLMKERVPDIDDFVDALARVAGGGTALDPEVVAQLVGASRRRDVLTRLSPRERDVLSLMAEGRSNAATLAVSERAVEKHIANIFLKLDLAQSETDHRRVLAVLRYLES